MSTESSTTEDFNTEIKNENQMLNSKKDKENKIDLQELNF